MQNSVQRRLEERPTIARPSPSQPCVRRARLPLGRQYWGRRRLSVPTAPITTRACLFRWSWSDWDEARPAYALSRPIFDEARWNRSIHHRSVREFLAAEWLARTAANSIAAGSRGAPFRVQYGVEVVVPTMRPVLPWPFLTSASVAASFDCARGALEVAIPAPCRLRRGRSCSLRFAREPRVREIRPECSEYAAVQRLQVRPRGRHPRPS
jgi:hypothetical protein